MAQVTLSTCAGPRMTEGRGSWPTWHRTVLLVSNKGMENKRPSGGFLSNNRTKVMVGILTLLVAIVGVTWRVNSDDDNSVTIVDQSREADDCVVKGTGNVQNCDLPPEQAPTAEVTHGPVEDPEFGLVDTWRVVTSGWAPDSTIKFTIEHVESGQVMRLSKDLAVHTTNSAGSYATDNGHYFWGHDPKTEPTGKYLLTITGKDVDSTARTIDKEFEEPWAD